MRPLYILAYLYPQYITYYLCFLYNLPNSTTSTSTTRLTLYIKDVVGTKAKNIKDHTTEDYNAENTIEVIIKTRPKRNTISAIRKNTSLQNTILTTTKPLINNTIDNLRI
jgi:hypothetical protein